MPGEIIPSWCAPELLRVQGENMLRSGLSDAPTRAEALFVKALDLARVQGSLGWRLRVATSLASMWQQSGRIAQARELLSAARTPIKQEHDSRDMIRARELHDRLG